MKNLWYFAGDGEKAYMVSPDKLRSVLHASTTTLDLIFDSGYNTNYIDLVRLTISSNTHKTVMESLGNSIGGGKNIGIIEICDSDNSTFINSNITNCDISINKPTSIGSGKHIIAVDQDVRFAHSGNDSVIVELSDVKIPAKAIITRVAAVVKTLSNLATHEVNIQMSATSGTAADTTISSGTELLGAGVANTDSTDSASASDISLGTSASDLKDVFVCNDVVRNGTSDQYLYVCNAGTGNGTTNSTVGTLTVVVEYYGID